MHQLAPLENGKMNLTKLKQVFIHDDVYFHSVCLLALKFDLKFFQSWYLVSLCFKEESNS